MPPQQEDLQVLLAIGVPHGRHQINQHGKQAGEDFGRYRYQLRDNTLDRATFTLLVAPLQAERHALLTTGLAIRQAKTRHLCENLLTIEPALWTSVTGSGVQPTNNVAERALRRAVLWWRRSFGTQSAAGSRFVERILTTVTTLRQQDVAVLDYLTAVTQAASDGQPIPALPLAA